MDNIYRQALDIQNRLNTYLDKPNDPKAQSLKREVQVLTDEIEVKKHKLSLEHRVKGIISILDSIKDYEVIDYVDIDDLKDRCEDIVNALRRL